MLCNKEITNLCDFETLRVPYPYRGTLVLIFKIPHKFYFLIPPRSIPSLILGTSPS